ncbi:MAG: hypothetical protein ABGZ36_15055, partial [Actinomycetota bacterium]
MTLLIDILSLAATYAVMASGFVVVYRTSRVLNLAQPGFVLLAGYLAVDLLPDAAGRSANPWVLPFAVVSLLLGGAAVGGLVYWALIRPLAGQSRISLIMMTLAMLFLLQALTQYIWSGANSFIPLPGNQTALELLGSRVRLFDLVAIGLGALVLGLIGACVVAVPVIAWLIRRWLPVAGRRPLELEPVSFGTSPKSRRSPRHAILQHRTLMATALICVLAILILPGISAIQSLGLPALQVSIGSPGPPLRQP